MCFKNDTTFFKGLKETIKQTFINIIFKKHRGLKMV